MFNVWFAGEQFIFSKLQRCDIDWENTVHECNGFCAFLNCGYGAKGDYFVVGAGDLGAGAVGKKFASRRDKAAIGRPKIVKDWRNDAIVHVSRNEVVKFVEFGCDLRVG